MSIKIMSMVFERYPNGGGEMLLALSLADFAEDDGTRVYPSIKQLAEKTRQSPRTVQYQLRKMEEAGWLILVNSGNGGRNQRREYVINPAWIKGADIAPVQSTTLKDATDDTKGAIHDIKGCNGLHPHIPINNPSIPINKPSKRARDDSSHFEAFWSAYPNTPRRVAKSKCLQLWKARSLDTVADDILSHVKAMSTTKQWLGGYEPAPLTYLNQRRWEDGIPANPAAQGATKHGNFNQQDYHSGVAADGSF